MARLKRKMTVKEILQDHEERHEYAEDFIERHGFGGEVSLYIPNVMLLNRDGINLELWDHGAYIRWCNNVDLWNDREDAGEMYMFRWNNATYWVNSLRTIVEGSESLYPEAEMILQVMDDDGLNVPTITWHTNLNTWDNTGDGSYSLVRTAAGGGAEVMFYVDKDDIVFNEAGRDTNFKIETDALAYAFFLDGGTDFLGLGTGTPVSKLHLYTDDAVTDVAMLRIEQDGVGDANLEWYLGPGSRFIMGIDNSDGNYWKLAMSDDLGTTTRLVVDAGGDLGIRCNPLANMHLHDPTTFCYFYITTGNRLTDVGIFWGDQYAGTDFYMGIDADDSKLHIGAGGVIGTNSAIQIDNTGAMNIEVTNLTMVDGGWIGQAGGPLLTFDDTNDFLEIMGCDVGIGTATPSEKLEVNGNLLLSSTGRMGIGVIDANEDFYIEKDVNNAFGVRYTLSNLSAAGESYAAAVLYSDNRTVICQFYSDGLGTGPLGTPGFYIGNYSNHPIGIFTNNIEKLRIAAAGNIGIGSTGIADTLLHLLKSAAELRIETADATDPVLSFKTTNTAHQIDISLDENAAGPIDLLNIGSTLFVEATNNRVGINDAAPGHMLDVAGDINIVTGSGYMVNDAAANRHVLIGDGTRGVFRVLVAADLPAGLNTIWQRAGTEVSTLVANDNLVPNGGNGHVGLNADRWQLGWFTSLDVSSSIVMADGAQIATAGGPVITFDDTNDFLEITGCDVGLRIMIPKFTFHISDDSASDITGAAGEGIIITEANTSRIYFEDIGEDAGDHVMVIYHQDKYLTIGSVSDTAEAWDAQYILRISRDGNVGLNTASPDTTLQVVGDTKLGDDNTNYMSIGVAGDTKWVGGGGLVFGSCYGNEVGWTQATAERWTWYEISDAGMITGQLHNVTHNGNGQLTVTEPGMYVATYTIALEVSGAGKHVQIAFSVNGSELTAGRNHIDPPSANAQETAAGTAILDLADNATVEIVVRTTDIGTPDISVDHFNLTLVQIGGT